MLLPPLLSRIAQDQAGFTWPVAAGDVAEIFPIRKRGHGGVLETVRALVKVLDTDVFDHACFVIILDRRTRPVQRKIERLIRDRDRFVMGIAIEEIEAWWLGDRTNTLSWSGFRRNLPAHCRYAKTAYLSERDKEPKRTLDELTRLSSKFTTCYGHGSVDLASDFVDEYWQHNARTDEIAIQCPNGFGRFQSRMANRFRQVKPTQGRLF